MDTLGAGAMSSTHGGNALSSRIALENIRIIEDEKLSENSAAMGELFKTGFDEFKEKYPCLGDARGLGLVWGLEIVDAHNPAAKQPDATTAKAIVRAAWKRGLLMIAPVGHYGNVLRLAPPLIITAEEVKSALDVLAEAFAECSGLGQTSDTLETSEDCTD